MLSRGYRKGPLETNDRRKLILNMTVKFEYTWEYITAQSPRSWSYVLINSFNFGIQVA